MVGDATNLNEEFRAYLYDIAEAAGERAELALFEGVGHRFDGPGQLDRLLERLETWVQAKGLGRGGA